MQLITAKDISKYFAHEPIFQGVSFSLGLWDKTALIWNNWCWKSTLFNIIAKLTECDKGEIIHAKWLKLWILSQYTDINLDSTILDYLFLWYSDTKFSLVKSILDDHHSKLHHDEINSEHIWELELNIKKTLSILKIPNTSRTLKTLSWWELKRLSLAKVMISDFDILLLDEPTNHLDIEMIEWLEQYLLTKVKTFFIITHDRYFLDRVCTRILEIDDKHLNIYDGSYNYYIEKKSEQEARLIREKENAITLYRKELQWMRRQPQARQTKIKSRIDAFDEVKRKALTPIKSKKLEIDIHMKRLWNKIIELSEISKSYDQKNIISKFSFVFTSWAKIWLVGRNWIWKSTLLDIITRKLIPNSWEVTYWKTVEIAYFRQDFTDFDESKLIIEIAREVAEEALLSSWHKISTSRILEMFNFPAKIQHQKASVLSYGEKKRLYLVTLLLKNPNFLILDEPTNDLDIFTLTKLEEFLSDFAWCILIVSHDRYFLDKLTDHILVFEGNWNIKLFTWTYSEFKAQKSEELIEEIKSPKPKQMPSKEQNRISKIERLLKEIEETQNEINKKLSHNPATDEITKLSQEYWELMTRKETLEQEWIELNEKYC